MSVTKVPMRGVNTAVDTAAGDDANIGWTAGEGLILTGQGSTNDITIKRDDDTAVLEVATGQSDIEITGGNILFGTADKGVYLGVTSATASNLLHDYEEGVYTGVVTTETSGGYTVESATDQVAYVKVGNLVTVIGYVNVDGDNSPNGKARLNLPFTPVSQAEYAGTAYHADVIAVLHADGDTDDNVVAWIDSAYGAFAALHVVTHGTGAVRGLNPTDVDGGWSIVIACNYFAA